MTVVINRFIVMLMIVMLPLGILQSQSSNPVPVQFFYVPLPEDQLLTVLQTVQSGQGTPAVNPVQSYVSIAAIANGTVIYYDQWENGFEPDISNPLNLYSISNPGGTQIWGDGNSANGAPPGIPGDLINAGTVIILNNPVTTTNLSAIDFDGRDKFAATKTIAVTRSGWATGPNTLLAAANETFDTDNWGTAFIVPAGEDMPSSFDYRIFGYTGLSIMAGFGGANVQVDADANGSYELSFSLAEGEAYLVNGGVNVGAKVISNKPVQVELLSGDRGEQYETRFFGLTPTALLSNEYYTPVSTASSAGTVVFLYNPNSTSMTVTYKTRSGSGGNTISSSNISLSAGGYQRVVMTEGYGGSFISTNGAPFHALSATDANNNSTSLGQNRTWDWGFSLVGKNSLTSQALVGLGIGRDPTSGTNLTENGNPVWVTPIGNGNTATTVYADFDANPLTGPLTDPNGNKYNVSASLRELDRAFFYDNNDRDQTGMLIYTLDNSVKLAVAWGQDPNEASAAAPGLDVGTGVPPVPSFNTGKNGSLAQDIDGDGFISPGDVLEYKIVINNNSRAPVPDIRVTDILPVDVTYVPNTTFFKNHNGAVSPIADDASGTAFPLDGIGRVVNPSSALPVSGTYEITFKAVIKDFQNLTSGIENIINTGNVTAVGTTLDFTAITPLFGRIGDYVWKDLDGDGIQDGNEPGIANITVNLRDGGGNVVATTTTNSNGAYLFTGLLAGNYQVEFVVPSAYTITAQNADGQGINGGLNSDANQLTGKTAVFALAGGEPKATVDAGFVPKSSVGDRIWNDTNGNGIQDSGEPGLSGVTVKLFDCSDNLIATTTTDGNGNYIFEAVPAGSYYVQVTAPSGMTFTAKDAGSDDALDSDIDPSTGKTACFNVTGNQNLTSVDAGLYPTPGTIGDFVWKDNNSNGIQDSGEPGIAGVTVKLLSGSTVVATTTTDANGAYSFANVVPGTYQVEFTAPANHSFTVQDAGSDDTKDSDADQATGKTASFTLSPGENKNTIDAGFTPNPGSIGDFAWVDDGDGIQESGEPGLAGVTVKLYTTGNLLVATTTTDANGAYNFSNVPVGTYYVEFSAPANYSFTSKDQGSDDAKDSDADPSNGKTATITVAAGQVNNTIDAGFTPNPGSIGDFVWVDDGDGIQEAGEPGKAGVTVNLLSGSTVVATTTTDANGAYSFANVAPGSYQVEFIAPANFSFSAKDAGSDDTKDSDADQSNGKTAVFTVAPGQSVTTIDAGVTPNPGSIGDFVWVDDGDGIQESGEPGLPGVTVKLYDNNNNLIATTGTDANGAYNFANVPVGDYYVEFTPPANYTFAQKDQGGDDSKDSDADPLTGKTGMISVTPGQVITTVDAGFTANPGMIGDFAWVDANGNGIQDSGESGLAGVTVQLISGSSVIATTTTDANGAYSFSGVAPGTYQVEFVLPANYTFTTKDAGSDDSKDSDADQANGKTASFTILPGQSNITVDAGFIPNPGSIGDFVWIDSNANGIQDSGEPGLAGVTIKLLDGSTVIATTTTDAAGAYSFTNVYPGSYQIEFVAPANFSFTAKDAGSDDTKDSDADQLTGKTASFTVAPGQSNTTIDAGLTPNPGSIGDFVWNDTNQNGIQDNGEAGLPNITIKLYDCTGTLVATTTTDANGAYQFVNIPVGSYYVKVENPSGYFFAPKDAGSNDALDSDVNPANGQTDCFTISAGEAKSDVDAGLYPGLINIGDRVWDDTDFDGVQDAGEAGLANVTVKLYDCNDVLVATTTTDANGNYLFANQLAGSYYIQFVLPSGYAFAPANIGSDDAVDSDADPVTGKSSCQAFTGGSTNNTIDAGMFLGSANLQITKVADDNQVDCGQSVTYTITVTNNGPLAANLITVDDVLPAGLVFVNSTASQGAYDNNTGVWNLGTLANGGSATLSVEVTIDCGALNNSAIDLGPASDYNVFVIGNINQPSADTQGKMAAGGNITLANYSVGDQLTPVSGQDVLVAGGNLTFTSGGIYGGNVAYGGTSNLPTNAVTIFHGSVRQDANVIDFAAAKTYLENLSTTLGGYAVNGTTALEWGSVNMTGNDPFLNVFNVNTSDITAAHTVNITVPNGSVVLVNMQGTTIDWKGGLFVNGTAVGNVIYNFPQATSLRISGIDIRGSILAPFADVNFVAGVQHGQMIAKNMTGQGQYNLSPFHGNIPSSSVINVAAISGSDQIDPVGGNNSSSATITLASQSGGGSGGGTGSGNWQLVGNLPAGEIVTTLESENNGNILAGTVNGYIYRTTDNGASWTRINNDMYSGPVWGIERHPNGSILAATVTGVYKTTDNGGSWQITDLQYKDVRTLKIDGSGNVYAGTWGFGMYVSTNCGLTWSQSNSGLGSHLIVTSVTVAPNQSVYAGTFDGGVFRSVDQGSNWTPVTVGYNYIWTLAHNSDGDLYAGTYGDGLYKSTDDGASWVKTSFPASFVYELVVDASDNVFAAAYAGGVFVSTDNGTSWTNIGMGGMGLSSMMIVPNSRAVYTGTASGKIYMQTDNTTGIQSESKEIPTEFNLSQNYPNPFNPSTKIEVKIAKAGYFRLAVYDMTGQLVGTLIDEHLEAGVYSPRFEAGELPSGIYIYKLAGENVNFSKKMVLIK